MKKPHFMIGLLASVGTAIGVLVAVVGLPYGRLNYTAFANLYADNGTTVLSAVHLSLDCDTTTAAIDDLCLVNVPGPATLTTGVTIGNNSGADVSIGAFNFEVFNPSTSDIDAPAVAGPDIDQNPNFNQASVTGTWACSPPSPDEDSEGDGYGSVAVDNPATEHSFLSCFSGSGNGPNLSSFPAPHMTIASVLYNVQGGAAPGDVVNLNAVAVAIGDNGGTELMSCAPVVTTAGDCEDTTYQFQAPPPTNTSTPTNTGVPTDTSTSTPTATNTPLGASVNKIPESCVPTPDPDNCNPLIPAANLWICEVGPCAGEGEGNLIVFEYATNVLTGDQNADTIADGLGAYEFSVEYDNFVIQSVNPTDMVFTPASPFSPGADGVADGEGAARAPATCSFSLIFENVIHFGCVTAGQTPGPTGSMDLAALNLIPHPDLNNDIFPGNDNGVVTVLKDNGCELVDVFGHPVTGSVNGGLTPVCGDLAVTVRILEGDLNLDCKVDITDEQLIAQRYGAFFGSLLYNKWFDLEPNLHDLDIDIKDLQKVFGRDGSTCQDPIPANQQQPVGPPVPFGN